MKKLKSVSVEWPVNWRLVTLPAGLRFKDSLLSLEFSLEFSNWTSVDLGKSFVQLSIEIDNQISDTQVWYNLYPNDLSSRFTNEIRCGVKFENNETNYTTFLCLNSGRHSRGTKESEIFFR